MQYREKTEWGAAINKITEHYQAIADEINATIYSVRLQPSLYLPISTSDIQPPTCPQVVSLDRRHERAGRPLGQHPPQPQHVSDRMNRRTSITSAATNGSQVSGHHVTRDHWVPSNSICSFPCRYPLEICLCTTPEVLFPVLGYSSNSSASRPQGHVK